VRNCLQRRRKHPVVA